MKTGTKIAIIGVSLLGIYLYVKSRRTPINRKPQIQPQTQTPDVSGIESSTGSVTNSGFSEDIVLGSAVATSSGSVAQGGGSVIPATTGTSGTTTNAGTVLIGPNTQTSPDTIPSPINTQIGHGTAGTGTTISPNIFHTNTPATNTPSNPCAPQDGFSVITFNAASGANITRAKQECTRNGGSWASTSTGGCCIKKNVTPVLTGAPHISSPVSNPSTTSCFVAYTAITMADGSKMPIQDVKVGMEVLSFNEETKNQEFSKVEETMVSSAKELVTIKTKSGIKIICTKEHPFWVVESATGWIQAYFIDKGDTLLLENGKSDEVISVKIAKAKGETPVYNMRISDNRTYYANRVLVHNKDLIFDQTYYGQQAQDIVMQLQQMYAAGQYNQYYSAGSYGAYVSP